MDSQRQLGMMADALRMAADLADDNHRLRQDLADAREEIDVIRHGEADEAIRGLTPEHFDRVIRALEETRAELARARKSARAWKETAKGWRSTCSAIADVVVNQAKVA